MKNTSKKQHCKQASVLVYYKGKMQAGLFVYNAKQVVQKGERIGASRRGDKQERERGTRVCPQQARKKHNATYKMEEREI